MTLCGYHACDTARTTKPPDDCQAPAPRLIGAGHGAAACIGSRDDVAKRLANVGAEHPVRPDRPVSAGAHNMLLLAVRK